MSVCTDDMCYLNQPLEAIRGKENVRKMIASIFAPAKTNFIIHTCIGKGDTVVAERTDQWDWSGSGHWEMELHVTSIFELTPDGIIYEWREYYDNEYWRTHNGPSLVWTPHADKPLARSKITSENTVRAFVEGWSKKDPDYLMSLMSDDIVYINQPLPPVVGQRDVKKIVKGIIDLTKGPVEWKLLNLFATHDGAVVCSKRLDQWDFTGSGKWELLLPCVGMFELNREGKITKGQDFFETSLWFEKGGPTLHV
ncbi:hypothetical protein DFJ74DRAFT_276774 [Hyaloraphidium curvatum]|nr:hypothetical protein DFJ74DRAFT_276774 [Hyaloraphidium curvatum]